MREIWPSLPIPNLQISRIRTNSFKCKLKIYSKNVVHFNYLVSFILIVIARNKSLLQQIVLNDLFLRKHIKNVHALAKISGGGNFLFRLKFYIEKFLLSCPPWMLLYRKQVRKNNRIHILLTFLHIICLWNLHIFYPLYDSDIFITHTSIKLNWYFYFKKYLHVSNLKRKKILFFNAPW